MKREQKLGIVGLIAVSLFLVSPIFQNCAKVNYQTVDPTTQQKNNTLVPRTITVDPTFNQLKADLKVLIVVDDSYTMSQSQAQLANAIDSLLNPLYGHNAEIKIVSTSGVPSNEVDYVLTNKFYSENGDLELTQSQAQQQNTYQIEKTVKNSMNNRHSSLRLFRNSTQSQFNQLKTQIKSTITSIGVGGSDTEEGFCAIVRQLYDTESQRFFKEGDKAAVILLSDENDTSAFNKCSTRYRLRVSNKPIIYYNYGQQRVKLSLELELQRDGVKYWQPTMLPVPLSGALTITEGATCSSADQTAALAKLQTQGYVVRNVTSCVYEIATTTYYGSEIGDDGTGDKNLCTTHQPIYGGRAYQNLYIMVNSIGYSAAPGSCVRTVATASQMNDTPIEFDSVFKSDVGAHGVQDFKLAISHKSNQLFGSNGFIFGLLVRVNGESCALGTGQSYGVRYQELNQVLTTDRSQVQSLCNTDFSSVLNRVSNFIVSEASNSFVMPLQDGEEVKSVTVIRGSQRQVLSSAQYEAVGPAVTLLGFTLQSGDTLEFELGPK